MRQKKNHIIYYVLGVILLAAIVFAVVHEVPMPVEHVETEISAAK